MFSPSSRSCFRKKKFVYRCVTDKSYTRFVQVTALSIDSADCLVRGFLDDLVGKKLFLCELSEVLSNGQRSLHFISHSIG